MPILNLKVSAVRSAALSRTLSTALVDATARILRKNPDITALAIDYVPPEDWIVGGRTLAEQGKASFWLDIKVVDGTNTKDEKAQYVRECFAAFSRLLPDLHEESYIHIDDVRAEAYGFGGPTQEYRYIRPQL